jgi:serine protease AprX
VFSAPRPPKGPSRLDVDGNGISDGLEAQLATLGPNAPVDVIVTFSGPGNAASARAAVGSFSVTHEYTLIPGFAATMRAAQARALAQVPGVFRVELDGTVHGYLALARMSFGVDFLNGLSAFPAGITGSGVVICVVDSGIWPFHAQLVDETGVFTKVEWFRDFVGEGAGAAVSGDLAHDEHWHRTAVASVAAGDGTPLAGGLGGDPPLAWPLRGVATGATLWGAQVLEPDPLTGGATGPDSGVVAGVDWCVAQAISEGIGNPPNNLNMVINLSLGSPGLGCQGDALAMAVDAAKAAGAVVVVAAGNSGDGGDTIGTPACAAGAFAVAAAADHTPAPTPDLSAAESLGRYVTPWSSRGAGLLGGATGPGLTIISAFNTTTTLGGFAGCETTPRGCYTIVDGTSFATPFVAGIAAAILEADPSLTPDQVYQILRDTAKPWGPGGLPNEVAGSGMVDGQAAVQEALGGMACNEYTPSVSPAYSITTSGVANNSSIQFPIWVVDPNLPLAITMSIDGNVSAFGWDPDLDMTLLDANGAPYLILPGWPFPLPGTTSTCPAGEDCGAEGFALGAQETIHVALPVAGEVIVPGSVAPHYFLEVYGWDGVPNNGKGGTFTLEFSNAYSDTFGPEAGLCVLVANAGPNQTMTDTEGNGEMVDLDGSNSIGAITSYEWTATGVNIPDVMSPSEVMFPIGTHMVTLTVSDGFDSAVDTAQVTVLDGTPNDPVVANAGPDQTEVLSDILIIQLYGSGSTPDGVTYAWTMLSKPRKSNAVLVDATTDNPHFDPDRAGSYKIELVVSFGPDSSTDTVVVAIEKPPKKGGGGGEDPGGEDPGGGGGKCNNPKKPGCS